MASKNFGQATTNKSYEKFFYSAMKVVDVNKVIEILLGNINKTIYIVPDIDPEYVKSTRSL